MDPLFATTFPISFSSQVFSFPSHEGTCTWLTMAADPQNALLFRLLFNRQVVSDSLGPHGNSLMVANKFIFAGEVSSNLSDFKSTPEFRKGTRNQIANIRWIIEKTKEFQKNIYFCFIDNTKVETQGPSLVLCDDLQVEDPGEKEAQDGGDICTIMTGLHCMTEISTTL